MKGNGVQIGWMVKGEEAGYTKEREAVMWEY
jgi:hypothetical protein